MEILKEPESSHQHILAKRVNKTSKKANKQEWYLACDQITFDAI